MSVGKWFLALAQGLITDALFKRPVQINVDRKADGSWSSKATITPSNTPPQQTTVYYGQPMYGHPMYAPPPQGHSLPSGAPASQPAPPPDQQSAPADRPVHHIPRDFQSS